MIEFNLCIILNLFNLYNVYDLIYTPYFIEI